MRQKVRSGRLLCRKTSAAWLRALASTPASKNCPMSSGSSAGLGCRAVAGRKRLDEGTVLKGTLEWMLQGAQAPADGAGDIDWIVSVDSTIARQRPKWPDSWGRSNVPARPERRVRGQPSTVTSSTTPSPDPDPSAASVAAPWRSTTTTPRLAEPASPVPPRCGGTGRYGRIGQRTSTRHTRRGR